MELLEVGLLQEDSIDHPTSAPADLLPGQVDALLDVHSVLCRQDREDDGGIADAISQASRRFLLIPSASSPISSISLQS